MSLLEFFSFERLHNLCFCLLLLESLHAYFSRYGEVVDCVVMHNPQTGRSRGFGFVTFEDPMNVDAVLNSGPHTLDGRTVSHQDMFVF